MAAMFSILSLIMYVKGRIAQRRTGGNYAGQHGDGVKTGWRWKKYLWFSGCGISGVLALASKETAAMLPVTIFLFEWYFFRDTESRWFKRQIR